VSRLAPALALALLLAAACGHYGEPLREGEAAAGTVDTGEAEDCEGCERKEQP
jgi:hypothetical protein